MEAVAGLVSPFPPPPHMPAERLAEMALRLARMSVDSFIGAWRGLSAWAGTRDRAHAIKTPTLVLWGDLDAGFLVEGAKRLAQAIEGAETAVVPQTAHQPQWERPDLYNAALGAFLNRVAGER
jgi:pimeloyl-ACP methyl ester carboxylesterase